jgi:hypothetical protein
MTSKQMPQRQLAEQTLPLVGIVAYNDVASDLGGGTVCVLGLN